MRLSEIVLFGTFASGILLGAPASANVTRTLNLTFQSGATFSGVVTFQDDYSLVLGVSGTLHGYSSRRGLMTA